MAGLARTGGDLAVVAGGPGVESAVGRGGRALAGVIVGRAGCPLSPPCCRPRSAGCRSRTRRVLKLSPLSWRAPRGSRAGRRRRPPPRRRPRTRQRRRSRSRRSRNRRCRRRWNPCCSRRCSRRLAGTEPPSAVVSSLVGSPSLLFEPSLTVAFCWSAVSASAESAAAELSPAVASSVPALPFWRRCSRRRLGNRSTGSSAVVSSLVGSPSLLFEPSLTVACD